MAGFDRLRRFLQQDAPLEVHARPRAPGATPDRTLQFLASAAAVAAFVMQAAAPAYAEAPGARAPGADSPVMVQLARQAPPLAAHAATNAAELEQAARSAARYIVHGHAPLPRRMIVAHRDDTLPELYPGIDMDAPFSIAYADECRIANIRNDYRVLVGPAIRLDDTDDYTMPSIGEVFDSEPMRNIALVHEDAHCRLTPFLADQPILDALAKTDDPEEAVDLRIRLMALGILGESVADAMGVAMLARRDGVDVARTAGSRSLAFRESTHRFAQRAFALEVERGVEADPIDAVLEHDTRAALRAMLDRIERKGAPASDRDAWQQALAIGVEHARATLIGELRAQGLEIEGTPTLARIDEQFRQATDLAMRAYDDPQITQTVERPDKPALEHAGPAIQVMREAPVATARSDAAPTPVPEGIQVLARRFIDLTTSRAAAPAASPRRPAPR